MEFQEEWWKWVGPTLMLISDTGGLLHRLVYTDATFGSIKFATNYEPSSVRMTLTLGIISWKVPLFFLSPLISQCRLYGASFTPC